MTQWPHLMVDVECMGTKSTAALMSIGGVFFDPATLTIGPTFHKPIHIVTSVKLGMQIEPEAVLFWLRQDQAAREAVMFNLLPIEMVLTDFAAWAGEHGRKDGFRIWGNSARFDLGILETAYNLAGIKVPWAWGLETCFRTVRNMHAHVEYDPANQKTGIAHSAVDDCIFQIEHLFKIKRYNDGHPRTV